MNMLKKASALLVVMYIYLVVPIVVISLGDGESEAYLGLLLTVFGSCCVLLVLTGIFNIISAVGLFRSGSYNKLRGEMTVLKMGAIPFFMAEYVIFIFVAVSFSLLAVFFFWTIAGPVVLMVMVFLAAAILYAVILLSSVYGIAFVSLLKKEKVINTGHLLLFIVLQIIPVADLIVTIVLLSNYRKRAENNLISVMNDPVQL